MNAPLLFLVASLAASPQATAEPTPPKLIRIVPGDSSVYVDFGRRAEDVEHRVRYCVHMAEMPEGPYEQVERFWAGLYKGIGLAEQPAKKVIEWGWDEPDTKFIRENIATMEEQPFDGLIFHVNSSKGGNFPWEKSVEWTAQPEKYRRHVEAGFGIWMDCRWRQVGWNLDDFSKNHFSPAEFATAVRSALDVSDEYVWIYAEQPRWWTNERLPLEYVTALKQTRTKTEAPNITLRVLYDNYSYDDALQTDWGFGCLITGPEKTILFDTGGKGELLMANMKKVALSPKDVDLIVISHNHGDHTGGLLPFLKENPNVGVLLPAKTPDAFVKDVQQIAAKVTVVNEPTTICDGAVVLGPMGDQIIEQALVVDTNKGLVIITGCSHPGVEVIAKKAKAELHRDIHMVLGGTHLLRHSDHDLQAVIDTLQKLGVQRVAPTHCSGDKAISMFREAFGDGFVKMGVGRVIEIDGE